MTSSIAPFASQHLLDGLRPDQYRVRWSDACEGLDETVERDIRRARNLEAGPQPGLLRVRAQRLLSVYQDEAWCYGSVSFAPAGIYVSPDVAGDHDGPTVRTLAAALLNAAEQLDRIG